ncbi:hypothetical protein [Streptacidiphilus fuscans]|uniref:Uncharacterized protein n=1 Tax=Streptacidiphilus fuscans TaxID=2789292 RepID=A0A931F9Y2_9ACTN|nr:hypothetical protein [Streptacidiphilus fuscans]MBF9067097.1 hypothetical protein [Streptacidiphilus fuscans]
MGDISARRQRILQSPPPELVAEAAANPGGSVAEIDPDYIGDPNGFIPGEAVQGVWIVGPDGKLTGEFMENPDYGPPKDDFAKLTESDHWLAWIGDDPVQALRDSITNCLTGQDPKAVLDWVKILDTPRYLTGARRDPGHDDQIIVTRAGLTLSFALSVTASKREVLTGTFSWVAVRLDEPADRKDQIWLDLWTDLDWAETELRNRIYLVGRPAPEPES